MRILELAAPVIAGLGSAVAAMPDELRYVPRHEELKYTFVAGAPGALPGLSRRVARLRRGALDNRPR